MMQFSANLGFLWSDCSLAEAIRRAKAAGFAAVECHFPYHEPVAEVQQALAQSGLSMLGLNTRKGDGLGGLAALPDRVQEARAAIDEALAYGQQIKADTVHVMAGMASGRAATRVYLDNLRYAADRAAKAEMQIVIEPLNRHDAPHYYLNQISQALDIISTLDHQSIRLMFDCYHVGRTEGDVLKWFTEARSVIGHVQFAGVPDRGPPTEGTLDYRPIFDAMSQSGWCRPLGAEYRVQGATEASLDWMQVFSSTG